MSWALICEIFLVYRFCQLWNYQVVWCYWSSLSASCVVSPDMCMRMTYRTNWAASSKGITLYYLILGLSYMFFFCCCFFFLSFTNHSSWFRCQWFITLATYWSYCDVTVVHVRLVWPLSISFVKISTEITTDLRLVFAQRNLWWTSSSSNDVDLQPFAANLCKWEILKLWGFKRFLVKDMEKAFLLAFA